VVPIWFICAIIALGSLVAIFAQQIGDFNVGYNAWVTARLPIAARRLYGYLRFGHSYNSAFWVGWNRIGGLIMALVAVAGLYLRLRH
jgi:hypothetical protein